MQQHTVVYTATSLSSTRILSQVHGCIWWTHTSFLYGAHTLTHIKLITHSQPLETVDFNEPISPSLERRVLTTMISICESYLEQYPTRVEDDEALMINRAAYGTTTSICWFLNMFFLMGSLLLPWVTAARAFLELTSFLIHIHYYYVHAVMNTGSSGLLSPKLLMCYKMFLWCNRCII